MKIAVIGASGRVGSRIVDEALARGHQVTAIVRDVDKVAPRPHLVARAGDVKDPAALAKVLAGHDVVVSAVRFVDTDPAALIAAVKASGVPRYLVVGGASSLLVAPGKELGDQPDFPEAYKPEANAGRQFLRMLRAEPELVWTFLSPSAFFAPGERTGHFRTGDEMLLTGPDGKSAISMEDYAIAMLDEIEHPAHERARFTVGY
ncbi:MAG TPA: NAD(P)-dependent oxidoreductase [Candidatus Sulfotelmatobacter sp.]|nr:NAD(P)-dependent oxidoreductase [Candidatus Sulfotelmatobacter sp.]